MQIIKKYYEKLFTKFKKFVIIDIDQTIVNSEKRYKLSKSFEEAEFLMDSIEDIPKKSILEKINKFISEGYYPIFLSGRTRSKKTNEQLKKLGFKDYFFIRNSKLYNPTLSSKFLKERFFLELIEFSSENKDFTAELIFVEDRPDIIASILNILKTNQIEYKKELDSNVFFIYIKSLKAKNSVKSV